MPLQILSSSFSWYWCWWLGRASWDWERTEGSRRCLVLALGLWPHRECACAVSHNRGTSTVPPSVAWCSPVSVTLCPRKISLALLWTSLLICLYCPQGLKYCSCMKFHPLGGGVLGHLAISQGKAEMCVTIKPLSFHISEQMLYIMSIYALEESHKAHADCLITLFFWWPKPQGWMQCFDILRAVLVPSFGWPGAAQSSSEGIPVICNMLSSWGHVFMMVQQMND